VKFVWWKIQPKSRNLSPPPPQGWAGGWGGAASQISAGGVGEVGVTPKFMNVTSYLYQFLTDFREILIKNGVGLPAALSNTIFYLPKSSFKITIARLRHDSLLINTDRLQHTVKGAVKKHDLVHITI
jgi:hypothetical protein